MSSRLKTLTQVPWTGGLVTALDESLIGPNALTQADDMYYTTQGTRRQRKGINENWDDGWTLASVSRSSTGTTRTVVTTGKVWAVGDLITVSGAGDSSYNVSSATAVTAVATTSTTNDTISYTASGSLSEGSTADTGMTITLKTKIICLHDYWYGSTSAKTHYIMAFTGAGQLYQIDPDDGTKTLITENGTAYTIPSGGIPRACLTTYENRLIVTCDGTGNVMKAYMPSALSGSGTLDDVSNTSGYAATPVASITRVFQGRIWANDKANPDRLHYCSVGNYAVWQGAQDSGAIDIGVGDGDQEGLTAIFPPFKGDLFVAKRHRIYRLFGDSAELLGVQRITDALGCVGHNACAAIDQDDIFFISDRGMHSIVATQSYGAFESRFVSADIQPTVRSAWRASLRTYIQMAYLSQDAVVAVTVGETADSEPSQLYLYNLQHKGWFRWKDKVCNSIVSSKDSDQERWYLGQSNGRVAQTFVSTNTDTDEDGVDSSVTMSLATGLIFPLNDPSVKTGYKKLSLMYNYTGEHTVTAQFIVDNFSPQSRAFTKTTSGDLLGTTFILGSSVWGGTRVSQSYALPVDGFGRGFKLKVSQTGENAELDLLGYQVRFEPLDYQQEDRGGNSA